MILIFTGAGFSRAISSKYPTTEEFYRNHLGSIKDNINTTANGALANWFANWDLLQKKVDIEWVLESIDEIIEYLSPCLGIESLLLNYAAARGLDQVMAEDMETFTSIKQDIHRIVYKIYSRLPEKKDKINLLPLLFREICTLSSSDKVEIFTTNYDRILDRFFHENEDIMKISLGHKLGFFGACIDKGIWNGKEENRMYSEGFRGRLTKLHGSINWRNDSVVDSPIIADVQYTGNDDDHAILYPGYKGDISKMYEPFRSFHEHLSRIVKETDAAIFIGFAFQDGTINEILKEMPSNTRKCVIHKGDKKITIPFDEDSYKEWKDGFSEMSIEKCIKYIQGG